MGPGSGRWPPRAVTARPPRRQARLGSRCGCGSACPAPPGSAAGRATRAVPCTSGRAGGGHSRKGESDQSSHPRPRNHRSTRGTFVEHRQRAGSLRRGAEHRLRSARSSPADLPGTSGAEVRRAASNAFFFFFFSLKTPKTHARKKKNNKPTPSQTIKNIPFSLKICTLEFILFVLSSSLRSRCRRPEKLIPKWVRILKTSDLAIN